MKFFEGLAAKKFYFWLLVITAVTLYFPIKINTYSIVVLAVYSLVHTLATPGKPTLNRQFWPFFLLFFLFVVGLAYTSNFKQGTYELEKKSAIVILPLIIFASKIRLGREEVHKMILYFFRAGLVISLGLCAVACYRFTEKGSTDVFFYTELTQVIKFHPIYFSYYLVFGLLSQFMICYKSQYRSYLFWVVNIYCIIMLVLLASKMVLALLFFITVLLLITFFNGVSRKNKIAAICLFTFFLLGSITFFTAARERVADILHVSISDLTQKTYAYNYPFNGLTLRLVMWKLSIQHLYSDGQLAFGVGTGDTTDYLNQVYAQHGLLDGGYINYNAHNEYIETLLALGLVGMSYLIFLYFGGLRKAVVEKNSILMVFLLIFALASWSESLLSVNKGIVFFSLFYPILLSKFN